ncbi:hypothetical protein AGLY_007332 [Aphis glycines]|uniref:Uncharacterized protein n=1 Tax=Aphis glycines TaxID=307491 RepID=A0A6G0TPC6_APHGL|nr:hypothetical protein AGLY_007332 [Aphis glycines]
MYKKRILVGQIKFLLPNSHAFGLKLFVYVDVLSLNFLTKQENFQHFQPCILINKKNLHDNEYQLQHVTVDNHHQNHNITVLPYYGYLKRNNTSSTNFFLEIFFSVILVFQNSWLTNLNIVRAADTSRIGLTKWPLSCEQIALINVHIATKKVSFFFGWPSCSLTKFPSNIRSTPLGTQHFPLLVLAPSKKNSIWCPFFILFLI